MFLHPSFSGAALTAALLGLALFGGRADAQEAAVRLQLPEVYELARRQNPMLQAARAGTQAVRALEASAKLPPDPQLQLGVMNASLPDLRTDMPSSMAPSVQVMQMVPFPGKLGLSGRIARQETRKVEARAEETWWEIRARAAMAFYEIYQVDRQIAVMRETVGLLQDFEQVAKAMYAAGEGRQSDVLRASVEVARMNTEIARMQAMRSAAAARLNAVLNRPAATPVPAVDLPALPGALPVADSLFTWAEASRPMLAGGRIGVEQAQARFDLARREIWPDLTVGVQYGQRPAEMGTERMGSLMVGVNLPVFAGQRQLQMRREATAMQQMAEAELADMRAQTGARIGELLAELDRDRTLVRLYRTEVLPQAQATVSSAFASYRVGKVDFMTLVDAQMTVNTYQQELYGLLADYGQRLAELEMAVGRELPSSNDVLLEDR